MKQLQYLAKKLFWLFFSIFFLIVLLFIGLFTYSPEKPVSKVLMIGKEIGEGKWRPKDAVAELPNMSALIKKGYVLITATSNHLGPMANDTSMQFAGNNLSCSNCHLKAGSQVGSASWVGVTARFPQFGGRANKEGTLEDRINGCMQRSLNGKPLPEYSDEMQAIVAYMNWLGEGLPDGERETYKGYSRIKIPETAVDLEKGKATYLRECVVCHAENGQGLLFPNGNKGYQYPPLWGPDSYNNGAGMHRVITSAEFIKSNMPFGQATWDRPKLTDEEAFNVAGYINSFDRPTKANIENDYPNRKLKPVSTPYGPWADSFSSEQHKYGPFPPIISYYKEKFDITKTK